jgi:hypothetical protein
MHDNVFTIALVSSNIVRAIKWINSKFIKVVCRKLGQILWTAMGYWNINAGGMLPAVTDVRCHNEQQRLSVVRTLCALPVAVSY